MIPAPSTLMPLDPVSWLLQPVTVPLGGFIAILLLPAAFLGRLSKRIIMGVVRDRLPSASTEAIDDDTAGGGDAPRDRDGGN